MDPPLNFHDVLLNSYENNPSALENHGFKYDTDLSNHNQQIYFNPTQNRLLYSVAGTHNAADVGTDIYMGLGNLKNTQRYKEANDTLAKAKDKYNPKKTLVVGSSLGGSIASKIGKREDDIFTYNKFSHIGERLIPNEKAYRASGDLVSIFNPKSNTKTISAATKILPIYLPTYSGVIRNTTEQHKLKNLKNQNIYI